jgi:hypothetical protein
MKIAALLLSLCLTCSAYAAGFDDLSSKDMVGGLRAALDRGAVVAIEKLGVNGGFGNNPQVKIPLPEHLQQVESMLRLMGQGKQADELVECMNTAAENAVTKAKPLLVKAVKNMTVTDAKNILMGGETSVSDFFKDKTQNELKTQFLPIVTQITAQLGLAQTYNQFAGSAAQLGFIKNEDLTIEQYVTRKAVDGLYLMIAQEEKKIRQNPIEAGSALLSKVFSALRN